MALNKGGSERQGDGMVIVVMGVSGSGKTTIGEILAERLGWSFFDADNFHSEANKQKMKTGIPLTDEDRMSWLQALQDLIRENDQAGKSIVLACSALKARYRQILSEGAADVRFVHLQGEKQLIADRLAQRKGHYMNPGLLDSQFEALEVPQDALNVDISGNPDSIADTVIESLNL